VTTDHRVVAVDLGATSIRVASVDLGAADPAVEVVHRWRNTPVTAPDGTLRWNWPALVSEVEEGLAKAAAGGPIASIGIDGWGVDYGLVDGAGDVVSLPFSYRDPRTDGWLGIAETIGLERIYAITGIQLMPINTIFQLAVHPQAELKEATRMLLVPDLLVHELTETEAAERSNASTTAMLDLESGQWSSELVDAIGVPHEILPAIVDAPRPAGHWRGIPVTRVGSHDTASAFLGMPGAPGPGTVFVSSGTWVLVGVERPDADVSEAARAANFSNERGALGGYRFLKNITGFWMLERCRIEWGNPPVPELILEAAGVAEPVPLLDAADPRFLAPSSMLAEIIEAGGFDAEPPRAVIVRCLLESIAASIATVVRELETITRTDMREVFVVGGGARVDLLNDLIARHTGLPVVVGSPEATALGNAIVQGLGTGRFGGREEARGWLMSTRCHR
jgi:rhamnulokinase